MRANLNPDIDLAVRLFAALHEKSFDGIGITREAYGPGERMAHALLAPSRRGAGAGTRSRPGRQLYLTLPGRDRAAKRIILGSHLDCVQQGGNYDGAAGVLAGSGRRRRNEAAGLRPARDITVMAIRAEEAGAWFPTSYPGSRGALGRCGRRTGGEAARQRAHAGGAHAGRGLRSRLRRGRRRQSTPDNVAAYLEVHIEQGPVLDAEGIPVGIITGIPGAAGCGRHG